MALVPLTIFIFLSGLILGHALGIVLVLTKYKGQINWAHFFQITPFIIPLLLIYALAFAFAISFFYPACITADGIYGYSFWGLSTRRLMRGLV